MGVLWVFMSIYGCLWVSVSLWVSKGFCESIGIYGCSWVSMDVYKYVSVSMGVMGVYGYL